MVIREYPYNMSYEKLVVWRPTRTHEYVERGGVKRISLYPWPGGYCTCMFEFDWSLCKIGKLR